MALADTSTVVRRWFAGGALLSGLGVLAGTFGAHALPGLVSPEMLEVFEIGVRYHLIHGLALLAVAWAASRWPSGWVDAAGWFFVAGITVFSGSLYILAVSGVSWWGAIAPVGGVCLLAGWGMLVVGALRTESQ